MTSNKPTYENLSKELKKSLYTNKSKARSRVKEGGDSLRDPNFVEKLKSGRERRFITRCWKVKDNEGRGLIDWVRFRNAIYGDPKSTDKDKRYADVLVQAITDGCYDHNVYGEWHHLHPLCMYGSVESYYNYVRLRAALHLKVHAALVYFFPSYVPLHLALSLMVNASKSSDEDLVKKVLEGEEYTNEFALARETSAKYQSDAMQGNQIAKKRESHEVVDYGSGANTVQYFRDVSNRQCQRSKLEEEGKPVPNELKRKIAAGADALDDESKELKREEQKKLNSQRRKLNKTYPADKKLKGYYTNEEIQMYNRSVKPEDVLKFY